MRIPGLRPVIDVVLDHSAERKPSAGLAEAMAALMATLAALIGAADMIGGILGKLFGEAAAAWIPAIVLVTLLVLSVYIVTARERQRSSSGMLAVSPKSSYVYTFAQPLRQAAKVATVLFLFAAPWSLANR